MTTMTSAQLGLHEIPLKELRPSDTNPRTDFDKAALQELADSIKATGVVQPLKARPHKQGGYEIVAGERRYKAAKMAGLTTVPVIVEDLDDTTTLEQQLAENAARVDLPALDEARALDRYLRTTKTTQAQLAKRVGKTQGTISLTLALLELPEQVKALFGPGGLTAKHGRHLGRLLKDKPALGRVVSRVKHEIRLGNPPSAGVLELWVDAALAAKGDGAAKGRARAKSGAGKGKARGTVKVPVGSKALALVSCAHELALGVGNLSRTQSVKVPARLFALAKAVLASLKGSRG